MTEPAVVDGKCYRGYVTTNSTGTASLKLSRGEADRYYVFSGSFMECALGEEVVENCFDPGSDCKSTVYFRQSP